MFVNVFDLHRVGLGSESEEEETPEIEEDKDDETQAESQEPTEQTSSNANETDNQTASSTSTEPKVVVKCKHIKQANPVQIKKTIEKGKAFDCTVRILEILFDCSKGVCDFKS